MRYHDGQLAVQRRAGGGDRAERLLRGMRAELPEPARAFLAEQRLLILSATDAEGRAWASPLHGVPGFAGAVAPDVLAIAARPDTCSAAPLPQSTNSRPAAGSAWRLPRVMYIALPP